MRRIDSLTRRACTIAGLVALAAACADAHPRSETQTNEGPDEEALDASEAEPAPGVCEEPGSLPIKLAQLAPPERYDYIAIRRVGVPFVFPGRAPDPTTGPEAWTLTEFMTLAETGEPCATATSGECMEKLGFHPTPLTRTSCSQLCSEWSLVTTRGDEVKRWAGISAVLALLGEIDSVDEALVLVASKGYQLYCPSAEESDSESGFPVQEARTEAREIEGGFEVIATREPESCPVVIRRTTLHVSRTGTVQEVEYQDFTTRICV